MPCPSSTTSNDGIGPQPPGALSWPTCGPADWPTGVGAAWGRLRRCAPCAIGQGYASVARLASGPKASPTRPIGLVQSIPQLAARVFAVVALTFLAASAQPRAQDPVRDSPEIALASTEVGDAVTTVGLHRSELAALGLVLVDLHTSVRSHAPHPISVADPGSPSFVSAGPHDLRVLVEDGAFHGFAGGTLRHRGGFRLVGRAGVFDFSGLTLRPGQKPFSLELLDASGEPLLATAQPQWELDTDRGRLRYFNADLRILPPLAQALGDERIAGKTVGVFAFDARLGVVPRPPRSPLAKAGTAPPCGDWSGDVDVALIGLDRVDQAGSPTNGRIVVVPSVTVKNVGTANVPWYAKFSGTFAPYGNDQHPFLVWQMARVLDGVLEPIGRSHLKHAFATSNNNCRLDGCRTDLHILGLGCEDLYGFSSNTWPSALAPRSEVTASTGVWAHCNEPTPATPSHLDTNGDCVQDHTDPFGDYFVHGMTVAESALAVPGARYFVEAFYVVRDDVDVFDSMGLLEVAPVAGGTWTFPATRPFMLGPIVDAWVDPSAPGPGADNRLADTGEGHLQLAVRVHELGGGRRRFAYALQNLDFDRRIARFHLPFDASTGVAGVAFGDGDEVVANNWSVTTDATGITWTAPPGIVPPAEADWGTLLSFRFEISQGAVPALSTLGVFEPGSPSELRVRTLAPGTNPPGDNYYTVTPCRLLDSRSAADGATPLASGFRHTIEVGGASRCAVPGTATAVAINVTATGSTGMGSLSAYSADLSRPPAASTLTFGAGATRATEAISMLSPEGKMALFASIPPGGSVHVLLDVMGYFAP